MESYEKADGSSLKKINIMKNKSIYVFFTFLWHDFYTSAKQIKNFIINYALIYPVFFSLTYGYIIPNTAFNAGVLPSKTIIFAGNVIVVFLTLAFNLNLSVLTDLEGDRFINYQMILLNPRLVILEKILFSTLLHFCMCLPFFAVSNLILQDNLDTLNFSMVKFLIILFLSSLVFSSYVFLSMCILKGTHQLGIWWRRCNSPLLTLGGSWVPWAVIAKFSTLLGYLILFNPILYITEGMRGAILGESLFIPFKYCVITLVFTIVMLILLSFYFFKKRVDHI